jgi:hypothetical protein
MSPDCRLLSYAFTFALLACLGMTTLCAPAWAYRPFDGTDAAVVAPGELEIELQPAGTLRQGSDKTLIAPATVVNVGLPDRWEAVFQGQGQFPLSTSDQSAGVTGVGAFLKHVLRPGSLQNESGPSIATEFGALLPGINADAGFGARNGVLSTSIPKRRSRAITTRTNSSAQSLRGLRNGKYAPLRKSSTRKSLANRTPYPGSSVRYGRFAMI